MAHMNSAFRSCPNMVIQYDKLRTNSKGSHQVDLQMGYSLSSLKGGIGAYIGSGGVIKGDTKFSGNGKDLL